MLSLCTCICACNIKAGGCGLDQPRVAAPWAIGCPIAPYDSGSRGLGKPGSLYTLHRMFNTMYIALPLSVLCLHSSISFLCSIITYNACTWTVKVADHWNRRHWYRWNDVHVRQRYIYMYIYIQSNLDYLNPRLSELRSQAKVQVKVQILGTISMCACVVECSAAIVRSVRANDS